MELQTIRPEELFQLCAGGRTPLIVDVRTPAEYARVHAQGARLVPLDQLDPTAVVAHQQCGPEQAIYVICQSGARAARACEKLHAAGLTGAVCVEGGTAAWERARLPVVRGETKVIPLERQVRIVAGSLVLLGVILGWLVHPLLLALSAFVGAGLVFSGVTDTCGMAMLLARLPWNRSRQCHNGSGQG